MDLSFTGLQDELRAQARGFLEASARADLGRRWRSSAGPARRSPRSTAAPGSAFLEEAVLHEEAGRALLHAPLWSTSSLAPFLPFDDQAAIAAGDGELGARARAARPRPRHRRAGRRRRRRHRLGARGRRARAARDERRDPAARRRLRRGGHAARSARRTSCPRCARRSLAILALEAVGVGARALELGIAYVAEREQFGRRIGSYQAVAHPLASSLRRPRARPLARLVGSVVRRRRRCGGSGRRGRREGRRRRRGRPRLRARDPGARRDRLHVGARAAPAVQARARHPGLGGVFVAAARRGRGSSARHSMRNATAKRAPLGMCLAGGEDQAARIRFCGFSLRGRRFLCRA